MFWEASALVPLLLPEPRSTDMTRAFADDRQPAIWWGTPVESHSAIARALRDGRIARTTATDAADRLRRARIEIREVAPTEDLRLRAIRLLSVHHVRGADALQLSAALAWCEDQPAAETFVCLDKRLRDAARREGFMLLPAD